MSDKRAIIDIGSNTVRLVVYNGPPRAPVVILNEKVSARLGKDLARTRRLSDKAMSAALSALGRFATMLDLLGVDRIECVATAATRDAENGNEFLAAVRALGLNPRLLSGEEEARASATGVIAAFPGASGTVGDLGGGSLELVAVDGDVCSGGITMPLGTLRLADLRAAGPARFAATVKAGLAGAGWKNGRGRPLFIVGGSWRALALQAMRELDWPLDDPHGFELAPDIALRICRALEKGKMDSPDPRISASRLATLPDAAALLGQLVERIEPSVIVFSSWGLREGLLYAQLDAETRAADPMLAGITAFARTSLVAPGDAEAVARWTAPIYADGAADAHLRLAATMLALAAMRSEPNMRAEQAMAWALRKRWIGLDARGRAMMAMTVFANSGLTAIPPEFAMLASEADLNQAIGWGLAVRLCRRLTGCAGPALAQTSLLLEDGQLVLVLDDDMQALYSNGIGKDLRQLADWLGLGWMVKVIAEA
ncbi:Ppx/GppA family phosphatase [Novosphingobium album (ex Liu et al. 2023)]|uniref:Ppx/GppA family phosphatase n=1 Tax=Novosphingobium album (ex Liu et al. 2023) TaxID=3031130 RepID=A0ABT5WJB5_9SPHN|nr:Ppx/GppA family phosphatase [Novosphingobium album (ex Liu et al. 2023)]MDE8650138.1 Ppx/GppA family phosphatase [Novosphingobium album (ex Liu et al. 2023)]